MPDTLPYDRPSDPASGIPPPSPTGPTAPPRGRCSRRSGSRDEDLAKPIIGVAKTWIETMPCNYNQRELAEQVKEGIRAAGGTPMEFNTIADQRRRHDGHRGHEGVARQPRGRSPTRSSSSRAATVRRRSSCLVGCDKTIPAAAMALGRLDIPGVVLYSGTIHPGQSTTARDVTVQDVFEAIGAHRGRQDRRPRSSRARERRLPGRRRLRRPVHGQHDGDGPRVPRPLAGRAERHPGRPTRRRPRQRAHEIGALVMDSSRADIRRAHDRHARGARERDRGGRRDGRLDQRRAAPPRHRPRARRAARRSTTSTRSRTGRRSSPTCSPAAGTRDVDIVRGRRRRP